MRMWMTQPRTMCDQHLLGEHVELHMFVGTIRQGKSLQGYIDKKLVKVSNIVRRHTELTHEMRLRGMKHNTPIFVPSYNGPDGELDVEANWQELYRRCEKCRALIWRMYPQQVQEWINASNGT